MATLIFRITLVFLSICSISAYAIELKGVGRMVPVEIFDQWGAQFSGQNAGITVSYKTVKATESIKLVEQGTADFADTDTPFSKEELEKKGLTQFPYMFTAITPVINLPGVFDGQLRLDGKTLADIYLGKITKWNDDVLVELNPRLVLPNEKIIVVHGSDDASGTYPFVNYLAKVNPDWKLKADGVTSVKWPVGTAMPRLVEMGSYVKKTPYSIGYTDISYARKKEIIYVQMKNDAGKFVNPHAGTVEDAVKTVTWKSKNGFNESITDVKGSGAWPIVSVSYMVLNKTSDNIPHRLALLKFIGWGIGLGDMVVTNLDFLPVNRTILPQIRSTWNDTPLNIEGGTVVDAKQVNELRGKGVLIVDARVAHEYEESHIPGALSIPYAEKSEKAADFNYLVDRFDLSKLPANKNTNIVFYCNAGACWKGYKAAVVAIKAGYKNVVWFRGGLPAWQARSFPVESSKAAGKS